MVLFADCHKYCSVRKSAFENCIVMGLVQDKDGKKMSKHLGNVVDPWDILDRQARRCRKVVFLLSQSAVASEPFL